MAGDADWLVYIASHRDLISAFGADPAAGQRHYEQYGRAEGRRLDAFDPVAYAAANVDVARAFGSDPAWLARHYIQYGAGEGRRLTGFDVYGYAAVNPDVVRVLGNDPATITRHYVEWGLRENRPTGGFDAYGYAAANPDVVRVLGNDPATITRHYVEWGLRENRPTGGFDAYGYAAANPDVVRVLGNSPATITRHYVEWGIGENRPTGGFDVVAYAAFNPDVASAFGSDAARIVRHYVDWGIREGRQSATIVGSEGADTLEGTQGDDRIGARSGDDLIRASAGNDTIVGGDGVDRVGYAAFTGPIEVRARDGDGYTVLKPGGIDELRRVEAITGTNAADRFTLSTAADRIDGGRGNDVIQAMGGGDVIDGGEGDDVLANGMAGSPASTAVDRLSGGAGNDTFGLWNPAIATGGDGNDIFNLNDTTRGVKTIDGGNDFDTVSYAGAPSIAVAGTRLTLADPSSGAVRAVLDNVEAVSLVSMGGRRAITVSGEGSFRSLSLDGVDATVTGRYQVSDFSQIGLGVGNHMIDVTLSGTGRFGIYTIRGATLDARVGWVSGADVDVEFGIAGDARIVGGAGDDRFTVQGSGRGTFDGGGGSDAIYAPFATSAAGVTIDLAAGTLDLDGGSYLATFTGIERAFGSTSGDRISGDAGDNELRGLDGDDRLFGGAGDDVLVGGAGDDVLVGGAGSDRLVGSGGENLLVLRTGTAAREAAATGSEGDDVFVAVLTGPAIGPGTAILTGNGGADRFVIATEIGTAGDVRITDFGDDDVIDLSALRTTQGDRLDFADVLSAVRPDEGDGAVHIALTGFTAADGRLLFGELVLADTRVDELGAGDFAFAESVAWQDQVPIGLI